jgi:AraC-like DNA-binding protein
MDYKTYKPHRDLESIVKCYWTLEVPAEMNAPKQRIVPDGCLEMCFILGDDIKRYTNGEDYILQPRAMVIGQISEPFYVQPTGAVNSFSVRFYPYSFSHFVDVPLSDLANKETPLNQLFDPSLISKLETEIRQANSTQTRIERVEKFLLQLIASESVIEDVVKSFTDTLARTKGGTPIKLLLQETGINRRSLERKFSHFVGISPKQLGKIIRLQAALSLMNEGEASLTHIAYDSDYYDQSHFTKDFKELTGVNPKEYFKNEELLLSNLMYSKN